MLTNRTQQFKGFAKLVSFYQFIRYTYKFIKTWTNWDKHRYNLGNKNGGM